MPLSGSKKSSRQGSLTSIDAEIRQRTSQGVLSKSEIEELQTALLTWFDRNKRDLPWRRTKDPYSIWISEIMLQQTRVSAVVPFYERFLARFPDCRALAEAPEDDLLAHWAGLGYYHRARNLQKAAKELRESGFPADYTAIRALPGIGEYTSAAIASIAFELPHASVDGNVLRVLSRLFADATDIGSGPGRKHFTKLAEALLARDRPGAFNQGMMELGATICLPKNPQCLVCPGASICRARRSGRQNAFPVKLGRMKMVEERRRLFWIQQEQRLLMWQRPQESRLMPGFWELPEEAQLPEAKASRPVGTFRHGITFHNYRFELYRADAGNLIGPCKWVPIDALEQMPVSTVVRKAQRLIAGKAAHHAAKTIKI